MKKFLLNLIMGEEKKEYQPPTELRIFSHALPPKQPNFPKWAKEFKVGTHKEPFEDQNLLTNQNKTYE